MTDENDTRPSDASAKPCQCSPWTQGACDLGTKCCYVHRASWEALPGDALTELASLLKNAGAVVYIHDADCAVRRKTGTCDRECGKRAYARAELQVGPWVPRTDPHTGETLYDARTNDVPAMFREDAPTYRCCICNKVNRGDEVATWGDFATCSDECGERYLDLCVSQGKAFRALQAEVKALKEQRADNVQGDLSSAEELFEKWTRQYQYAWDKLRETLLKIRAWWDMLNPTSGQKEPLSDGPWMRNIIDEALAASTIRPDLSPRAEDDDRAQEHDAMVEALEIVERYPCSAESNSPGQGDK